VSEPVVTAADRWARVGALFDAARALPPAARRALLDACRDDELRLEVEALLDADQRVVSGSAGAFLERLDPGRTAALLKSAGTDDDVAAGEAIGRYRVVRRLGRGGMGVVYLAHDPRLDRMVALKLLPTHLSTDPAARSRLEQEARAASALDHPNIVTVYEIADAADGRVFIAMALCEGPTLREELDDGVLPVARVVELAAQIADGLGSAHARGVVHRDVKPRNIIVTGNGTARIVDFGVATTRADGAAGNGLTPGTLAYMSPEQTRGGAPDARSDVWSLGVLLYEMLAGRRPFDADDEPRLIRAIRNDDPEPLAGLRPDAPAGLCRLVERCLSRDPAQRPADGRAVATELRALRERSQTRRRRVAAVTGTVFILAAIAVGLRAAAAAEPRLEPRRVAVAPVENRTGAAELDELAGMATDWMELGLLQTGVIEVVSLSPYGIGGAGGEAGAAPRTLARSGGARLLLAASLYRQDGAAWLQARVIDVTNGRVVQSVEPVAAALDARMDAVEELRRRVQSALNAQLDTQLTHVAAVSQPPRLEAYREYRTGRDRHASRDLAGALSHFQRAAALDSTFMLPHVVSAIILNTLGRTGAADSVVRRLEGRTDGLDAFTMAHVAWLRGALAGDRNARIEGMREAARLAPGSTLPGYQYAEELLGAGRPREALRVLDAIEPERGELRGWLHYWQVLAASLHLQGSHRRELREARRARELYPDDPRALLLELHALAALGRTGDIERLLLDVATTSRRGEPSPGALMLATALELRVHPSRMPGHRTRKSADQLLERALAWYESVAAEQRTVRSRYEHTHVLALLGRRAEARRLLAELAAAPPAPAGPSPVSSRGWPHFPEPVTYRGAAGLLAAQEGDTAAARDALAWLESADEPYSHGRPAYWRGAIMAALGDHDGAVTLLRRAFDDGMAWTLGIHHAPELEPVRRHRAFRALTASSQVTP
jgi:tetratricopeptide (TPR) repeat protein